MLIERVYLSRLPCPTHYEEGLTIWTAPPSSPSPPTTHPLTTDTPHFPKTTPHSLTFSPPTTQLTLPTTLLHPPTTLLHPSSLTTHLQPYHTLPPLHPFHHIPHPFKHSTSSEWCMRTHYICHPTVLFTALSNMPSPFLHTSPSHHASHTHPHLPQTSTPPTHLHSFPHTNCSKYLLLQSTLLVFRSLRTFDEHNSSD